MLHCLHGFWSAGEPAVGAWFDTHPAVAETLQWSRRARLARLQRDVDVLASLTGIVLEPVSAALDPFGDELGHADVLGWLYVAEGSTLGGAVIDHAIRRAGLPVRLESFTPYPEGPQPMWRSYLAHLEQWTDARPDRIARVVAAGVQVFEALELWIAGVTGLAGVDGVPEAVA